MKSVHYVMPMAGRGSRFNSQGFELPKPLIEIYGKPFFFWSTISISKFIKLASLNFIVLQEHIENYAIDRVIKSFFPEAKIIILSSVTEGAVITCMKGIDSINDSLPILFNDCDHLFTSKGFYDFCNSNFNSDIDGLLLTFKTNEPKYSFIKKNSYGNIVETAEKKAISDEAICGCYYFKNKEVFLDSAKKYLLDCKYSEYFMSGVYNIMIENNKTIKSLPTDFHIHFGTPEEYELAKKSIKYKELL